MATRKDQLQSYQFMMQRVVSSVVLHEADPEQAPLRRGMGALFIGVMLTGLLAVAFGVYAVISGNAGDRWQEQGGLIIEKETGAHYLYENGLLQPVLNYTSARLLSDGGEARRVPGRNLADVPRAVPVGIVDAPDSLPPPDRVVGPPWTICSIRGPDQAGGLATTTVLVVGERVSDPEPLADRAMLVRDAEDGTRYLVWRSHRYRVGPDPEQVIRSLYGASAEFVDAGTAWLNGLPSGPDIGPIDISGRGQPSNALPRHQIGEVLYHPVTGGEQYYLVLDDGLAIISDLQVRVLGGQYTVEPEEILAAEANAAPTSAALPATIGAAAPPPAPPELVAVPSSGAVTLCAETADAQTPPQLTLGGDLTRVDGAIPTNLASAQGNRLADLVLVPPGQVAVVLTVPSGSSETGSYQLVTDVGRRYPVPSEAVLGMLGYSAAEAVRMPAALVHRIPAGPTLDPAAARQPLPLAQ